MATSKQARRAAKKARRAEQLSSKIRCDDCGKLWPGDDDEWPHALSTQRVIGWPEPGAPIDTRDVRAGEVFVAWCPFCGCETATTVAVAELRAAA